MARFSASMINKNTKPFLTLKRGFAATAQKASASTSGFSTATTSNGIKVLSSEALGSPASSQLASISVVLNNGSRFETPDSVGGAHFLKAFAFRNSEKSTGFRKVREAELQGAMVQSWLTREDVVYSIKCFKQDVPYFFERLAEASSNPLFNHWEFNEVSNLVKLESAFASSDPSTVVREKLFKAAYRAGLGNSIYASSSSPISSSSDVQSFFNARFSSDAIAVVGTGVSSAELLELVQKSPLANVKTVSLPSAPKSVFYSGSEIHTDSSSELSHYTLAYEVPDSGTGALLSHFLGTNPNVKWGSGLSPLGLLSVQHGFSAHAFSDSFSDSSIVGVHIVSEGSKLKSAVKLVSDTIKSFSSPNAITEDAFGRAIANASMTSACASESQGGILNSLVSSAFGAPTTSDFSSASASSLSTAAASVFSKKPAAASLGNSLQVPYLDSL
ncbi:hypothetical protein BB560_001539 [Smittium megazygosporum]|uniref:Cytochrome b-c1 complex subunit 2, mitochondrial n=1 Tax=Smittium megazygosporum TaxID=133381 RepID=A0A2T9ZH89_9FUNG|nr:hypothetical protein BB560_001539 [Smittium megazygosporum]